MCPMMRRHGCARHNVNLVAILRVALLALRINKMRSALTMLGIIIGVAAVIVMIAVGNGAQARVEEQIKSIFFINGRL